jgi:hypothetical protein
MDNTPEMELISADGNITIQEDITMFSEGEHTASFNTEQGVVKAPMTVKRDLLSMQVEYTLGNKTYRSILYPDGRVYNTIMVHGDDESMSNPYEIQDKGLWRYVSSQPTVIQRKEK